MTPNALHQRAHGHAEPNFCQVTFLLVPIVLLVLEPNFVLMLNSLGLAFLQEPMHKEGAAALEKVLVIRPGYSTGLVAAESTRGSGLTQSSGTTARILLLNIICSRNTRFHEMRSRSSNELRKPGRGPEHG